MIVNKNIYKGLFFGKHVHVNPAKEIIVLVIIIKPPMRLLLEEVVKLISHASASHTGAVL